MFDIKDKANQAYAKYFRTKKALVVGTSGMNRSTMRKLAANMGIPSDNIILLDNYVEAEAKLNEDRYEVVLVENNLRSHSGFDLLTIHRKTCPYRLDALFLIIMDEHDPRMICRAQEEEVDGFVFRPFTYDDLEKEFLKAAKYKVSPTKFDMALEKAKLLIIQEKLEEAKILLDRCCELNARSAVPYFYLANIALKKNMRPEAKNYLHNAVKLNLTYYKALSTLFRLHIEDQEFRIAFTCAKALVDNFPINLPWIPYMVKIFLASGNYEELLNVCEKSKELQTKDPLMQEHIAAGLAMGGRYLLRNNQKDRAREVLVEAAQMAQGKMQILASVVSTLMEAEEMIVAEDVINRLVGDKPSNELQVFDLEIRNRAYEPVEVLRHGMELLNRGVKDPKVYTIVINRSIELGRKNESVDELILEASRLFPDKKQHFEKLKIKV